MLAKQQEKEHQQGFQQQAY
jgi:hypothetical protein